MLALFGFTITFLLSLNHNILSTSIIRGLLSGIIFFLLAFALRLLLGVVFGSSSKHTESSSSVEIIESMNAFEEHKGRSLDLTTPNEDDELNQLLKQQPIAIEPFKPLNPPKLSTKITDDPKQMAQAMRQMSEE